MVTSSTYFFILLKVISLLYSMPTTMGEENTTTTTEEDFNPCNHNNGGCAHICDTDDGKTVRCTCQAGYTQKGTMCYDVATLCKKCSQRCRTAENKIFECYCDDGYSIINKTQCYKNSICVNRGGCSHNCIVTGVDTRKCGCIKGYILQGETDCIAIKDVHKGQETEDTKHSEDSMVYKATVGMGIMLGCVMCTAMVLSIWRWKVSKAVKRGQIKRRNPPPKSTRRGRFQSSKRTNPSDALDSTSTTKSSSTVLEEEDDEDEENDDSKMNVVKFEENVTQVPLRIENRRKTLLFKTESASDTQSSNEYDDDDDDDYDHDDDNEGKESHV